MTTVIPFIPAVLNCMIDNKTMYNDSSGTFRLNAAFAFPRIMSLSSNGVVSSMGQVRASFSMVILPAENIAIRAMITM